jgi:hypothetical protein
MSKNIKVFKFITGEEVILEVVSAADAFGDNTTYTVRNGLALMLQSGPQGQGFGISLIPWASTVKGDIALHNKNLIFVGEPEDKLMEQYERAFSKIAQPAKTLLVG